MRKWHAMVIPEVLDIYDVDVKSGLHPRDAKARLKKYGPNELPRSDPPSIWVIFLQQFKDYMVLTLLAATAISAFMGEIGDAFTIILIIGLNAVLGTIQEYRAEKSLEALSTLTAPTAKVLRDGEKYTIPARNLVPGDVLLIEGGDVVPADARLLNTYSLEADESTLTGESHPARKLAEIQLSESVPLADRKTMIYMGTTISRGKGMGVVVTTGLNTEMGQIATMISEAQDDPTPLQRRLQALSKNILIICLSICSLVVITGVFKGEPMYRMFLAGVSLAVAAIPEGLPAVVTIGLALGVQRMLKRNAVIRHLHAVETLGCAEVICSDKTGTLTKNEMTVKEIVTMVGSYRVSGEGYEPTGRITPDISHKAESGSNAILQCLTIAALCNNSEVKRERISSKRGRKYQWVVKGDPTEGALVVAAMKAGITKDSLYDWQRLLEIPFESERRCMSVLCRDAKANMTAFVKGAPDTLIPLSKYYYGQNGIELMTWEAREHWHRINLEMASKALRILAVAYRDLPLSTREFVPETIEKDLVLTGLIGMMDPPRPEVQAALNKCRTAGIKVLMITGDQPVTAEAVAREIGLASCKDVIMTGDELDNMPDSRLEPAIRRASVIARVSPRHKMRIVKALKAAGQVVAMTGDGVNDAPAIKEADIGISMGLSGTDVTKEASSMILTDDNFASIVAAIEEGRSIYENIRKFIRYLLSCNTGEVLVMFLATALGLPLPLVPIQLLWVNLVTDGLPAIALGVDPPDPDIMQMKPRDPDESVFSRGMGYRILGRGALIGLATLTIFIWGLSEGDLNRARTYAFVTLVGCQLVHVFDCRSETKTISEVGILGNPYLLAAVACSIAMTLLVLYHPALSRLFKTVPFGLEEWPPVLFACFIMTILSGVRSVLFGAGKRRNAQKRNIAR